MSKLFEEVVAKVEALIPPQVSLERTEGALRVLAAGPGSYPIQIIDGDEELTIAAGFWHTHSADVGDAVGFVHWMLTPFYRVVQRHRGDTLVDAQLQRFEPPGRWETMDKMGVPLAGLFGKRSIETSILQQKVIKPPADFLALFPAGAISPEGFPHEL